MDEESEMLRLDKFETLPADLRPHADRVSCRG